MPSQGNRISYPCASAWTDKKGRKFKQHGNAYVNAIKAKNGRYMYIKTKTPYGELVIWLPTHATKAMIKFLEEEKPLLRMTTDEKAKLYGRSLKDQGFTKENAHLAPTHNPKLRKHESQPIKTPTLMKDSPIYITSSFPEEKSVRTSRTAEQGPSAENDSFPKKDVHSKPRSKHPFAERL